MERQIRAFWRDFAIQTVSVKTVISWVFLFSKAGKFKTRTARVPYNKLLTNPASSSRTGEHWPSVVFVRTSLHSVRTATTSGQYSPERPSRSVRKRLILFYDQNLEQEILKAVCCKDQLRSCNIEKTDFPKLCQNKGLGELVLKI